MAAGIEAVIAALRVALDEAEKSSESLWKVEAANRWIGRLPGRWTGRWRKLMLAADAAGEADRAQFIGHVRAVIAYLEAGGDRPQSRKWWPVRVGGAALSAPKPAPQAAAPVQAARPINLLRVRKPMPGVH